MTTDNAAPEMLWYLEFHNCDEQGKIATKRMPFLKVPYGQAEALLELLDMARDDDNVCNSVWQFADKLHREIWGE